MTKVFGISGARKHLRESLERWTSICGRIPENTVKERLQRAAEPTVDGRSEEDAICSGPNSIDILFLPWAFFAVEE